MTAPPPSSEREQHPVYDLVVIGGGVTGAGAFRDAALRGLDTLLLERRDFASGTSSRSAKLIHGGLRYLQQAQLKLVFESVNERRRLRTLARHLVRPLGFYFPRFKGQFPGVHLMRLGLLLYEGLTGFRVDKLHSKLSRKQTIEQIPGIRADTLTGMLFYYDAKAADARLVWECVLGGSEAGGQARNYCEVVGAEQEAGIWILQLRDTIDGQASTVRTRAVVAAVGPWGNRALKPFFPELDDRSRPTKGVHIVLPAGRVPVQHALAMQHPRDRRPTFVIPGRNYLYCGTTETDYNGDPDEPSVTRADVDYLLEVLNHTFPDANYGVDDVTATWSGLRPLIQQDGKTAFQVSREHQISEVRPRFLTIEGGKLTTFRVMAEQVVDAAIDRLGSDRPAQLDPCRTTTEPLPGARGVFSEADLEAIEARVHAYLDCDADIAANLAGQYGTRVFEVLPYVEAEPQRVLPGLAQTWGELQYVVEHEQVRQVEDVLLRRTEIYYQDAANGREIADAVAVRLQKQLGQNDDWRAQTVRDYLQRVDAGLAFKKDV